MGKNLVFLPNGISDKLPDKHLLLCTTLSYHLFKVVMLCLCFPNYRYCTTKTNGKHFNFSVSHINEKFRDAVPNQAVTTPSILFP